jgi:flagellar assembly protein FliH
MNAARKFLFDTSFDAEHADALDAPAPQPEPEPVVALAELETAREAAYAEGRAAALAEAANSVETRIAGAVERVSSAIEALLAQHGETTRQVEANALELVQEVLRKLAPAVAKRGALVETIELLRASLREALAEPRIVLRIGDPLFEEIKARLTALTEAAGYAGKVVLLADETLGETDARVEWADGGAERDFARTWTDVEAAMGRALAALAIE